MVSYFRENLNKRTGAVAQTVYTDVYNCLRRRLEIACWQKKIMNASARRVSRIVIYI